MLINLGDYSPEATYHLMTQSIIPRPIAWILTKNIDGKSHNLAPFSYFTAVSSNPPLLMFSAMSKDTSGTPKDTIRNIRREKQFVVHIASSQQLAAVENSSKTLDYGESEVTANELSLCDFTNTGQQRLTDAPIAMACTLHHEQSIGNAPQTLIFAQLTHLHIADAAANVNNNRITIDAEQIEPLARLGLGYFADIDNIRRKT